MDAATPQQRIGRATVPSATLSPGPSTLSINLVKRIPIAANIRNDFLDPTSRYAVYPQGLRLMTQRN